MRIVFTIIFLLNFANTIQAQKVFNQLTDLDGFFVEYYKGYFCVTYKDGSVVFGYYDKDVKFDTPYCKYGSSYMLRKFNNEGNIVAKVQPSCMKNNAGDIYRFEYFQEYEDRLYGIGSKSSAVKNQYNVAKDYYVVTEFDKNTLQPIYSNEYTLFAGYDSFGTVRQLINGTVPLIEDNKFFQTHTKRE